MYVCMYVCMYVYMSHGGFEPMTPMDMCMEDSQKAECTARSARVASFEYTTAEILRSSQPYTYIHTYIHTYTHTYIQSSTHTYIYTYKSNKKRHTYIHTYIHTYKVIKNGIQFILMSHTYIHALKVHYISILTYIHTYINTYIHSRYII